MKTLPVSSFRSDAGRLYCLQWFAIVLDSMCVAA